MKHGFIIAILALALFSCKKDEESSSTPTTTVSLDSKAQKKWYADGATQASANGNTVWWVELTSNKYIISFADGTFKSGNYSASSDKEAKLSGYGEIELNTVSDSTMSFTLTNTSDNSTVTTSSNSAIAPVISSTSNTNLLCRNWHIDLIIDPVLGNDTIPDSERSSFTVIFSPYGTYFLTEIYTDGTVEYTNRFWQWSDASETAICYGETSSVCNGQNEVDIDVLNTSKLEMSFDYSIVTGGPTYTDYYYLTGI